MQPVETVGAMFDPRVHEALGSIETAEHPDHQVLEEVRRGYKIRDKLLRPALVKIASNSAVGVSSWSKGNDKKKSKGSGSVVGFGVD